MSANCLLPITVVAALGVASMGCRQPAGPEVVAYVAVDRKDAEPVLRAFEAATGIRVLAVYDAEAAKTTGLVARLLAEAARPRCDVFWNNEIVQTMLLAEKGLLDVYRSPEAQTIAERWQDPAGRWTAMATRARVIVYNTRHVPAAEAPRRLQDLAEPRWRGKVALANPQFGTTRTHVAALFAAWGPDRAQAFLESLRQNEVRIVDGNAMVKNQVARAHPDASPVYVGLTDTDDVLSGQAEGQPIDMVYPDQDTDGTLVIPSTVGVLRGSPHPAAARRLVDYLLRPGTGARFATSDSGYQPIRALGDASGAAGVPVRAMPIAYTKVLEQLEPSSAWTEANLRP